MTGDGAPRRTGASQPSPRLARKTRDQRRDGYKPHTSWSSPNTGIITAPAGMTTGRSTVDGTSSAARRLGPELASRLVLFLLRDMPGFASDLKPPSLTEGTPTA
ncbi:hypothetical protein ACWC2T_44900 [Streptomyces sp. NPDC001393]